MAEYHDVAANLMLPRGQQICRVYVNAVHVPLVFAINGLSEVHAYAADANGIASFNKTRDAFQTEIRRGPVFWLTRDDVAAGRCPHQ